MSTLFVGHYVQFFDDNGNPLSNGSVEFFEPGTSTPKDIYTDSDLSVPSDNPVTLDAAGRATVWLNGDYKARLEDSTGSLVEETDNINPPITTETTGGNLIANGSFETAGTAATDADGWTLTAQSDGTVERITADNYDGEASLKFTSLGNGGGQADTNSFFAVSPGRNYGVSFAIKCSVADIRNIVQVRYFDEDQAFLSNSSVYDEDTNNPTDWELKSFSDTPPSNARFAKLRILGADQSDATSGEAKFDSVSVQQLSIQLDRFPNVNADVTATDEEINKLDGFSGSTSDLNSYPSLGTLFDATNGGADDLTEIDFTGIKSGAKRITILFDSISTSGTETMEVRIGDSGGIESSDYHTTSGHITDSAQGVTTSAGGGTTGFLIEGGGSLKELKGSFVLHLIDPSSNTWVANHTFGSGGQVDFGGGRKSLSAELDRVRIATGGSDTFDNGNVNILVE